MDFVVSDMEFRSILESMIPVENERLRPQSPSSRLEFQLIDGLRRINVPDEGMLILQLDENRVSPSMSLFRMRKEYHNWLDKNDCNHSSFWVRHFIDDTFRRMEENLSAVQKLQDEIKIPIDSEKILDKIIPCICKTSRNQNILMDVSHREILDLSIYYCVDVEIPKVMDAEGLVVEVDRIVDNRMLEIWNRNSDSPITEETLFASACENAKKVNRILNQEECMLGMLGFANDQYTMPEAEYGQIYVVTNQQKKHGAASVFLGIGLDEFIGDKDMNFYILPSSVHETVLIPDDGTFPPEELAEYVSAVNASTVAMDDLLSDNVYFYDHRTKSIQIAYSPDVMKHEKALAHDITGTYSMGQPPHRRGR